MADINEDEFKGVSEEDKAAEIHIFATKEGQLYWRGPDDPVAFYDLMTATIQAFNAKWHQRDPHHQVKQAAQSVLWTPGKNGRRPRFG